MDLLQLTINQNTTIRELLGSYHVGKKKIYDLWLKKAITINGVNCSFDEKRTKDETLIIDLSLVEEVDFLPSKGNLSIIYEDNDLLIINKPSGIIIHPDSHEGTDTLVNRVASYYLEKGIHRSIRYAHRLDIDTTGIIVFSKHFLSESMLDFEVKENILSRSYLCVVQGHIGSGIIEKPIGRNRHNNCMIVSKSGEYAKTKYEEIKFRNGYSLVKCDLFTGRTHQIRVHLASIGHPLVGDKDYGGISGKRVLLSSSSLKLVHPITKKTLCFDLPIDKDMEVFFR